MLEGEAFYQIANYDRMRPFFMTVVSDADHWLFISSNGGLTAGRRDANNALFPYYTDDKIRDLADLTGSKTLLRIRRRGRTLLWEPFSDRGHGLYRVRRNLFKNFWGNKLIFEEINDDLGLTFRYGWFTSQQFGFVRRTWLTNTSGASVRVEMLDGVQNLMPCGVGSQFNLEYSTLLDAYKRSELEPATGLGLFRLSAIPVDRPEPAESLRTNVAWRIGLKPKLTLLSAVQLDRFRTGETLQPEIDVRGERGAYFAVTDFRLRAAETMDWLLVADVNQGPSEVARLNQLLLRPAKLRRAVLDEVRRGTVELRRLVAGADGLQHTAHSLACARHYSNTLFNIMRGGVFADGYRVDARDVADFVRNANRKLASRHAHFFRRLPENLLYRELVVRAGEVADPQLERVCREYLPLTFSRRHGDPSRPWNRFAITTRNDDGTRSLNYEGNWRDIFQNWEALAASYPGYIIGMICRFLNASTADGYNPYRITRAGIDWEVVHPQDPWSFIGYWGDHQIIYLLKLLEHLERHEPGELHRLLGRRIFAYANVPYRIKPYAHLRANPKDTVAFDHELDEAIRRRVANSGADGKLMWGPDGEVRLVNLTEKLLVPLLAKLSNFVPGAGIWLNTQRPEWNDANNALVGNGCSMVTLYYLRRYLTFCDDLLRSTAQSGFALSADVAQFLNAIYATLRRHRYFLRGKISDTQRERVVNELGRAGSAFRRRIYENDLSVKQSELSSARLLQFIATALDWINHSIQTNRRPDGLYHAYNLVRFDSRAGLPIRQLYEMLEGQVAVLSSGRLSAEASLDVLVALRRSAMYRADQHSYTLYPNRDLPRFGSKNNLPIAEIRRSKLLQRLLADGNRELVERDCAARIHFNPGITNARDVRRILEGLAASGYAGLVRQETNLVLEIFECLFDHASFTGRSGTFFGYEGLGSIYWHMNSKLLLAVQETYLRAVAGCAPAKTLRRLAETYHDIRAGLGDSKSPLVYGAFPMDPYSHTPAHAGARQPGLTGQVKEDFLCRLGELGVMVNQGEIHFRPRLLQRSEFVTAACAFDFFDVTGATRRLKMKPGELAFTYCQVPVVYRMAKENSLSIKRTSGAEQRRDSPRLNVAESREVFDRTGAIQQLVVNVCLDD